MTDTTPTSNKAPTHAAYHVRDREGKKAIWTRIGAAWPHADGKGFTAHLDCVPPRRAGQRPPHRRQARVTPTGAGFGPPPQPKGTDP